ncbi:hypothetical protein [Pseudodesulfovibrio piezophilus]|uniref:Uncharacterized protein n=1 Tax=Pseudodesulfovibrio piezophilus (strain DSM 21447 / JCM 15486 / C1TLV30) TaxID=1322246 RepID=M1WN44_PSEP2|nr:hypothetical protein [Pseudodesulfovibrio piezophilus]CCH47349.1 conserved protein of unknown function [Pseudodesulfovibrio piezophilus C1TLV30]
MNYIDQTATPEKKISRRSMLMNVHSPLASVGMQARNFTAAIDSSEPGIAPEFYTSASLVKDLERLCDPHEPTHDEQFLNVAVKYFYSYVHDGAHGEEIGFTEIVRLYEQFSRHQSLNEPADDIELMNRLRQWSMVLRVLADAPRAAHIMRAVIGQQDAPQASGGPYVGVDIGAGTGIMLLAQQIQAHRNGFTDIQTLGYQTDTISGERTHDLVHSLGMGSVMLADPTRPGAYGMLQGRPISYVANEMVAGIQQSLSRDNFFNKYSAFFAAVGVNADKAAYFPEGLIAHSGVEGTSVILAKENRFTVPAEFMDSEFIPQGLIIEGKVLPMHKLGRDFEAALL